MSRGYDSIEYLEAYRRARAFPPIHRDLFGLVVSRARATRFLDLGCCTGLLGQRLKSAGIAEFVIGVEASAESIRLAREYGVTVPLYQLRIGHGTLPELGSLLSDNRITAVVARRCFPEILADDPTLDAALAATLAASGVRQLFIEGRQVSSRSTHRLSCIENEIAAVSAFFTPSFRRDRCVLLSVRPERAAPRPAVPPPAPSIASETTRAVPATARAAPDS
jgi:SAM-dependent methyltransferase